VVAGLLCLPTTATHNQQTSSCSVAHAAVHLDATTSPTSSCTFLSAPKDTDETNLQNVSLGPRAH
jgi:hypothetical protein